MKEMFNLIIEWKMIKPRWNTWIEVLVPADEYI